MTGFALPLVSGQAVSQAAGVASSARSLQAGRTDRGLTAMAVAGVAALSALGWVLSYTALRQLALAAGLAQWAATLWPLCVDLFVFVATLAAVADRRQRQPTTYAWTLAVLYSAATVAGNVAAAGPTHLAQAAHAMPAVTMVLAWHLLSRFFASDRMAEPAPTKPSRHNSRRLERPVRNRQPRRPALEEAARCVAELEASGQRVTGDALAARLGVSDRTGRRLLVGCVLIVVRTISYGALAGVVGLLAGGGMTDFRKAARDTRAKYQELLRIEREEAAMDHRVRVALMIENPDMRDKAMLALAARAKPAATWRAGK